MLLNRPQKQNIKPWLTRRVSLNIICFTELGHTPTTNSVIYCDNLGATHLSANLVFHSCMKHIALVYHFVRENVQHDQLADIITKPLLRPRFDYLWSKLHLSFRPYNLRQDINNNN